MMTARCSTSTYSSGVVKICATFDVSHDCCRRRLHFLTSSKKATRFSRELSCTARKSRLASVSR